LTEGSIHLTWLGHAAFRLKIGEKIFIFDPWIEGNPSSPLDSYRDIELADYVFVTHDHRDHGLLDGAKISAATGARFVGVFELVNRARELGVENALPGNLGGVIRDGDVEIYITRAYHSSGVGTPCGFVVRYGGFSVYHAGDTSLFSDMRLIGERWNIDIAFLPIGSTYTMDPHDAARAVEFLGPGIAVPMHYNTFPQVEMDPRRFEELVRESLPACNVLVMEPGKEVLL